MTAPHTSAPNVSAPDVTTPDESVPDVNAPDVSVPAGSAAASGAGGTGATRPPRLVVLNGPPGIGKTTIARRYVADHPLALALDIDAVRRLLGGWLDRPLEAGLLARELSLAMARTHLANGHDVVLPQYLGRAAFLQQAEDLAREVGAGHVEIVLTATRDVALRRFAARTAAAAEPAHVEAAELVARLGGEDTLGQMYDRLLLVLTERPAARLVGSPEGQVDRVYAEVLALIEAADPPAAGVG